MSVGFPDLQGRIDHSNGFVGGSPSFHKWCRNLFSFYWDKSEKTRTATPYVYVNPREDLPSFVALFVEHLSGILVSQPWFFLGVAFIG